MSMLYISNEESDLVDDVKEDKILEKGNKCYGCLYDRMGQNDHMECNSGCLHDPETCIICCDT